jgi:hypothetical protein
MTIINGFSLGCLINNQVVVDERTLLKTTTTIDSNLFINKDKCFRIVEEVIPLLGLHQQNNSLAGPAPVQNTYML